MKNIEKEQEDRRSRILELQKCIANKEESIKRRIERQKKNQEIAESAANESQDQDANTYRNYLYVNKLWNNFMRIKMKKEMAASERIDEAFKKIKTHTTVSDVQAMVRRFQQREQTYTAQLQAVSTSEQKVDMLKKANEELTKRLQELQIDAGKAGSDTAASTDGSQGVSYNQNDTEIIQMNSELAEINRSMSKL